MGWGIGRIVVTPVALLRVYLNHRANVRSCRFSADAGRKTRTPVFLHDTLYRLVHSYL